MDFPILVRYGNLLQGFGFVSIFQCVPIMVGAEIFSSFKQAQCFVFPSILTLLMQCYLQRNKHTLDKLLTHQSLSHSHWGVI